MDLAFSQNLTIRGNYRDYFYFFGGLKQIQGSGIFSCFAESLSCQRQDSARELHEELQHVLVQLEAVRSE